MGEDEQVKMIHLGICQAAGSGWGLRPHVDHDCVSAHPVEES